jgi:hypothetical protein
MTGGGNSVSSYNGRVLTTISVVSDTNATASTIPKRDSNADITAHSFNDKSGLLTAGTGTGFTGSYYSLIQEDTLNRYTAVMRRDYATNGSQTIGIRVGNGADNNNYHYAAFHVFDAYAQTRVGSPVAGVVYIDSAAGVIHGTATAAYYADVAEKYLPDGDYDTGTVLVFGGEKEVTLSTTAYDKRVAGVVSAHPAYLMNEGLEDGVVVALLGRVPCKVVGKIRKGDLMVTSDIPGVACAADDDRIKVGTVIGKALENYDGTEVGVIEVAVGKH